VEKRITVRSILLLLLTLPQLAMAISQSFNSKDCPAFDAARFWLQSLMTAECCKKIAGADEQADDVIRDLAYSAGLSKAFMAEFATDHRDMTSELAKIWSLPAPMAAAYRYRSFADSHDDERLGLIVSAGVMAVENVNADASQPRCPGSSTANGRGQTAEDGHDRRASDRKGGISREQYDGLTNPKRDTVVVFTGYLKDDEGTGVKARPIIIKLMNDVFGD